ncbi:phage head spike fiber domain-containing protein [Cupriavidus necator]
MRRSALRIARPLARSLAGSSPVAAGPLSSLDLDHLQDKYSSRDYDMFANKNFTDLVAFTRASTKWVPDATGTLLQVASGAPATAYDSLTLDKLGFSVEEQRTNMALRSAEFDNAAWGKTATTVTANAATAPDGSTSADQLIENNGATGSKELYQTLTGFTAGNTYAVSAYAKAVGAGAVRRLKLALTANSITVGSVSATFDIAGASVATSAGTTASIQALGNGWFRCVMVVSATVTASSTCYLTLADTTNSQTYTGDGVSGVYLWGYQIEQGAFPTSYIPTAGAQVTRAADSAVISNIAPWFNPAEGTFYVEGIFANPYIGAFPTLLELSDGTTNNRYLLRRSAGVVASIATTGGASNTAQTATATPDGLVTRAALVYSPGAVGVCLNGATPVVVVGPTSIPGLSKLSIGSRASGNNEHIGGQIRAVRYFPRRLSNSELQALTVKPDPGFTLNFDFGAQTYYMGLA